MGISEGLNDYLLSTDARIIAENATHAVLAIRIQKQWLQNHLSLLAALSNLVDQHTPPDHVGQITGVDDAKG